MKTRQILNITGDTNDIAKGTGLLQDLYGFEISNTGITINVVKCNASTIKIAYGNDSVTIQYGKKVHFYRALGLVLEKLSHGRRDFLMEEEPNFDMVGLFLDCSRNAVPKVETLKHFVMRMAVMGMTMLTLYMEDTYEVAGEPYFGYMRGRYTPVELKEIDDYAALFGVEVMATIQTLGHMEQALKWDAYSSVQDTGDILLADEEKTYELIDKMIGSVASPLRSRRLCIGMDEAYSIGLGKYLSLHGYTDKLEIMSRHLEKVVGLCKKHGRTPYMASDMYFALASKSGWYYDKDVKIPDEVIGKIPQNVCLAYWDYINEDEEIYRKMFRVHKQMVENVCFVGGMWCWSGMGVNYQKSLRTSEVALKVCKEEGIREVIMATFGDNGAEGNYTGVMLGMQQYAEHAYTTTLDSEKLAERFYFCTGNSMRDFLKLGSIDNVVLPPEGSLFPFNPSKYLLYQDILMGLFDRNVEGIDLYGYYGKLADDLAEIAESPADASLLFRLHEKAARVLEVKGDLGLRILKAYQHRDSNGLYKIVENILPDLLERVKQLRIAHRELWMSEYKPFGWEVIDIRYGGLMSRLDTAAARIKDFLEGKVSKIDELEEKRLCINSGASDCSGNMVSFNSYIRTVTAGIF